MSENEDLAHWLEHRSNFDANGALLKQAAAALTAAEGRIKALGEALGEAQAAEAYQRGKAEASAKVIARLKATRLASLEAARSADNRWPDPLESPQAEAIRSGKIDDTSIRDLFDKMERELKLHREAAIRARK